MNWQPVKVFPGTYGIPTAKMNRAQWLEARKAAARTGIGGSEIGVLLGLDLRFNSPIRMFYQRLGLWKTDDQDNKYAFMGRFLEEQITHLWKHWDTDWETTMAMVDAGRLSRKSRACNYIIKNPDCPSLFANIDNRITKSPDCPKGEKPGPLECKTISGHAADRYETGIPPKHIAQLQSYMLVTGTKYSELAVLESGIDFQVYPIYANETIQNAIVQAADDFMGRVMAAREELQKDSRAPFDVKMSIAQAFEPEVKDGDDEYQFLSEKAKLKEAATILEADGDILEWYSEYVQAKDKADNLDSTMMFYKNKIRQEMVANEVYQYKLNNKTIITNGKRFLIK